MTGGSLTAGIQGGRIVFKTGKKVVAQLDDVVALLPPPSAIGSATREIPGVASFGRNLPEVLPGMTWLRGTQGNAGRIPRQVAERLAGREFANFGEFRRAFWKAVSDDPVLSAQFTPANRNLMRSGFAPFVESQGQRLGSRARYEIDHLQELQFGGNVMDMDNLVIRTPLNHVYGK